VTRNPEVDRWFDERDLPLEPEMRRIRGLEGEGKLVRTMRFADLHEVEAGRADLEAVIRAWCAMKAG
jgi:hypothetical protein